MGVLYRSKIYNYIHVSVTLVVNTYLPAHAIDGDPVQYVTFDRSHLAGFQSS